MSLLATAIYYFAFATYIPPVVALVIGRFLVGDEINPLAYVAMILILSGVAVLQFGSRPTEDRSPTWPDRA